MGITLAVHDSVNVVGYLSHRLIQAIGGTVLILIVVKVILLASPI